MGETLRRCPRARRSERGNPRVRGTLRENAMKAATWICMVGVLAGIAAVTATEKAPITLNLDSQPTGQAPQGFEFGRTGGGALGKWVVKAEPDAPSAPNVLAQLSTDDTDYRFPVAFTGPELQNLRLSVKCKPVSGRVDQGCGLVFRLKDPDNYYIARANALEDNVRLYHVVEGKRIQFAG